MPSSDETLDAIKANLTRLSSLLDSASDREKIQINSTIIQWKTLEARLQSTSPETEAEAINEEAMQILIAEVNDIDLIELKTQCNEPTIDKAAYELIEPQCVAKIDRYRAIKKTSPLQEGVLFESLSSLIELQVAEVSALLTGAMTRYMGESMAPNTPIPRDSDTEAYERALHALKTINEHPTLKIPKFRDHITQMAAQITKIEAQKAGGILPVSQLVRRLEQYIQIQRSRIKIAETFTEARAAIEKDREAVLSHHAPNPPQQYHEVQAHQAHQAFQSQQSQELHNVFLSSLPDAVDSDIEPNHFFELQCYTLLTIAGVFLLLLGLILAVPDLTFIGVVTAGIGMYSFFNRPNLEEDLNSSNYSSNKFSF